MNQLILQVEDSEDDALLLKGCFKYVGVTNRIVTVTDGDEAIAYLKGEGVYAERHKFPLPGIILVDLKLPRKDGFALLGWIQKQPHLKKVLTLVLTGTDGIGQVHRAYKLGARSFLTKPLNEEDVKNLSKSFKGFFALSAV